MTGRDSGLCRLQGNARPKVQQVQRRGVKQESKGGEVLERGMSRRGWQRKGNGGQGHSMQWLVSHGGA